MKNSFKKFLHLAEENPGVVFVVTLFLFVMFLLIIFVSYHIYSQGA